MFNDKIYVSLWWWYMFAMVTVFISALRKTVTFLLSAYRSKEICSILQLKETDDTKFVNQFAESLSNHGLLLLILLTECVGPMEAHDVAMFLKDKLMVSANSTNQRIDALNRDQTKILFEST
uniref:Innexin n=1 Tax=Acrobeloides nanus TaxID=290746 RepID=A0A914CMK6_9BILA